MENLTMPKILALYFDGVICIGLLEYFQTTQRTYQKIWTHSSQESFDALANSFYQLRPVIETGWEMPILLRALILAYKPSEIETNWPQICSDIVTQEKLDKSQVMDQLDG
ncbi:MAG: HAD family hydrolase, partial [Cyanobacteria bacterium P01_G01_bin.49]